MERNKTRPLQKRQYPHPLKFDQRINFIQVICSSMREGQALIRVDCKLVDFMRPWSTINGHPFRVDSLLNQFTRDATFFEYFEVENWS